MSAQNPFQYLPLESTRFWYWLLRRRDPRNIAVEINNFLIDKHLDLITPEEIQGLKKLFPKASEVDWNQACERVLANYCLSRHNNLDYNQDNVKAFRNLGKALGFNKAQLDSIDINQALSKLEDSFDQAISEKGVEKVLDYMASLYAKADLNTEMIELHEQEWRTRWVQKLFSKAIEDNRYTPEEEAEFNRTCEALKVSPIVKNEQKGQLERMRNYYRLENEPLPEADFGLALQKGERCHWCIQNVSLNEIRKQRVVHGYRSSGVSFRIMKGVYYRVGSSRPVVSTYEGLTKVDQGDLYFTNKRIWYNGYSKNISIPYSKIMQLIPYTDGIQVVKGTGKDQYFLFSSSDVEADHIVVSRLLNEA